MLRSILIGLDGSDDNAPALELGLRWARAHDATAIGIAVVDEPGILASEEVLFEAGYHRRFADPLIADARRLAGEALREFSRRYDESQIRCQILDGEGTPSVRILEEAQRYDLVLLGRRTHFDYGSTQDSDETLARVVRDSPRPVVAVPEKLTDGHSVVVAYDGSLQAARALYAFESSGLGRSRPVHVVSVVADRASARRIADRACDFLRSHALDAQAHPVESGRKPAEVILEKLHHLGAGLLVMGAYGQPVLREFFLGSVTRSVLEASPVPVFCYH